MRMSDVPDGPSAIRKAIELDLFSVDQKPTLAEAEAALEKHWAKVRQQRRAKPKIRDDNPFDLID